MFVKVVLKSIKVWLLCKMKQENSTLEKISLEWTQQTITKLVVWSKSSRHTPIFGLQAIIGSQTFKNGCMDSGRLLMLLQLKNSLKIVSASWQVLLDFLSKEIYRLF
jgi:hypothetical protein